MKAKEREEEVIAKEAEAKGLEEVIAKEAEAKGLEGKEEDLLVR